MRRTPLVWSALAAWLRPLPSFDRYAPPIAGDAQLAIELEALRARTDQPAMAVGIVRGAGPVCRAVAGHLVSGEPAPATLEHRFHIGSITKSFTSVLLAQLVEEGLLGYDSTLGDLLPDVSMVPEYAPVTVQDLLLGRSGLILFQRTDLEPHEQGAMLFEELPRRTSDPMEQRRLVTAYALSLPPRSPPGTRHEYSNVAWSMLGHLLERAAGKAFEELVGERLFQPLGMTGARLGGWPARRDETAQPRGHFAGPTGPRPQPIDDPYLLPAWMNPAGGIHCPVEDLAAWGRESLLGLKGAGRLLPPAAYARIHAIHVRVRADQMYLGSPTSQMVCFGYGWGLARVGGGLRSAADGSAGTFYARVAVLPAYDLAFVGLTNSGDGEPALSEAFRRFTNLPW